MSSDYSSDDFIVGEHVLKKDSNTEESEDYYEEEEEKRKENINPIIQKESEVSKKKNWKRATVPYQVFCNIDPNRPIRISVFDRRSFKASIQ